MPAGVSKFLTNSVTPRRRYQAISLAVAALPRTRLPERFEGFWSSVRFPAGMPDSLGAFAARSHRAQVWLLNWLTRPTSTGLFLSGQCSVSGSSYQAVDKLRPVM